ncbi:Amino acid adenylation domain-containing protein OS=Streptomyces griseomycini OX=66895 GN=FHS37_006116 PE=4 SV=1 [Streptomyces griseomycini]
MSGDPGFRELVGRVRSVDLAAFAHQDLPFEQVVEALNPVQARRPAPLFQVMLTLQNTARDALELLLRGRSRWRPGRPPRRVLAPCADRFAADGAPAGVGGGITYAADLFDRTTAEAVADRLTRLLDAVGHDPGLRVAGVSCSPKTNAPG